MDINKFVQILHEHYTDSCRRVFELESKRNRQFLAVITIAGLTILAVRFPISFQLVQDQIEIFNFSQFPSPVIVSILWTFFIIMSLLYCQSRVQIEKLYEYIYILEPVISSLLNCRNDFIYKRESERYLSSFNVFTDSVWIFYRFIYPVIIGLVIVYLLWIEWNQCTINKTQNFHLFYDIFAGILIFAIFILVECGYILNKSKNKSKNSNM